jgi:hypothetical protein
MWSQKNMAMIENLMHTQRSGIALKLKSNTSKCLNFDPI